MKVARLALALVVVASLAACKSLGALGNTLQKYTPKLTFKKLDLKAIDFTKVDVEFVFDVHNPNVLAVKAASFSYDLGLEGVQVVKGTNDDGIELKSYGDTQLAIPVSLTFAHLYDLVKAVKGKDDLGFALNGELGFSTPLGVARVPFKEQGRFPVVHAPSISLERLHIGKLDILKHSASLSVDIGVGNANGGAAVTLAGFDYGLDLGGARVASGVRDDIPAVVGGGKQIVSLPIDIDLLEVGKSLVDALKGKKALDVKLAGKVMVGTPFGKLPLTFDQLSSLIPN